MLNWFAKLLLVSTALSPILGAIAVSQLAQNRPWTNWLPWLFVALLLTFLCWALLRYAAKNAQKHTVSIAEFERRDSEVLAFLLAYLLPFIAEKNVAFNGQWLTGIYVLLLIGLVISHAGAFHFNPVMGLLGYHFYAVKNANGAPLMVISTWELNRIGIEIETVRLAPNIYLKVGGVNA